MRRQTTTSQIHSAVDEGWVQGGSFVSSILAGTLLGRLLDWWLGTDPWLVVAGVALGAYSGFVTMWRYTKKLNDETPDRRA